jgi:multiple sugar transport system permease protein
MSIALQRGEAKLAWKFLAPSIGIVGLLILYPLLYNLYLSFFEVRLSGSDRFVGLDNYVRLLGSRAFYGSLWTTLLYLVGTVTGTTLLGLGTALLMNQRFPGRGFLRVIILLPYFAPVISVVFAWQFIFDPVNGIYNHLVVDVLGISDERRNLIADPRNAVWAVVIFDIWKHFPLAYLLILAKLQSIGRDQYEAAALDGYGAWGRFFHVTLPELYFVLGTIVLLRFIWNLNKFEEVFLLSPNVDTLPVFTYRAAFTGLIDQGFAAAVSVVQFAAVAGLIFLYVKKILKW